MQRAKQIAIDLVLFVALVWAACQLGGCKSGLTPGYRALYVLRTAGDQTSSTMGQIMTQRHEYCSKNPATYQECISLWAQAGEKWVQYVKPAINSALSATWGALETAYKAKKDSTDWVGLLKPGVCALLEILKEWKDLLGDKVDPLTSQLGTIEGLVCP